MLKCDFWREVIKFKLFYRTLVLVNRWSLLVPRASQMESFKNKEAKLTYNIK